MEQVNSIRDVAVWKLDGKIEYPRRTRTLYVDRKYFFETFEILIIVEFYYYFKNINSRQDVYYYIILIIRNFAKIVQSFIFQMFMFV